MYNNNFEAIEKLEDALFTIYTFGYTTNKAFKSAFHENVTKRLPILYEKAKYVNIEKSYVETEWKDLISLHYINTTYANELKNRVIRVHFFKEKVCSEDNYVGFITLRPIQEMQIALSYVIVNWNAILAHASKKDEKSQMVTYNKRVHCMGKELFIKTYPLLVQDSIVTCCVDVNLITLTRFLSHKGMTKKLSIKDMCGEDINGGCPKYLTEGYISNFCKEKKIPLKLSTIDVSQLEDEKQDLDEEKQKEPGLVTVLTKKGMIAYINAYLNSNLPVFLCGAGHVVQIVGYIEHGKEKRHIIFDDSGSRDPQKLPKEKGRCIYNVDLYKYLYENNDADDDMGITIGVPTFERVYIDYPYYETFLFSKLRKLADKNGRIFSKKLFESDGNYTKGVKIMSCLIECSTLMQHLRKNLEEIKQVMDTSVNESEDIIENQIAIVENLEKVPMPHYVWYTEVTLDRESCFALCADPTRYYVTDHPGKVFFNGDEEVILIFKPFFEG